MTITTLRHPARPAGRRALASPHLQATLTQHGLTALVAAVAFVGAVASGLDALIAITAAAGIVLTATSVAYCAQQYRTERDAVAARTDDEASR